MSANTGILSAPKSTVNRLDCKRTFATKPGLLIPALHFPVNAGESYKIKSIIQIDSLPLKAPLLDSIVASLAFFYIPWRALLPELHNGAANMDPSKIYLPRYDKFALATNSSNPVSGNAVHMQASLTAPNSLENFLYFPVNQSLLALTPSASSVGPVSINTPTADSSAADYGPLLDFGRNGVPYFGYYSIFYHYYANFQEPTFPIYDNRVVEGDSIPAAGKYSSSIIRRFPLSQIEDLTYSISSYRSSQKGFGFQLHSGHILEDISSTAAASRNFTNIMSCSPEAGLVFACHYPDNQTAFINPAARNSIRTSTAVNVENGTLYMDDLVSAMKIKKYKELSAFGASDFRTWVYSQFGVTPRRDVSIPAFLSQARMTMNFKAVIANSAEGLGDLGGRGSASMSTKWRRFNFLEPGTVMAIFTLKPIVQYNEGMSATERILRWDQIFTPALNRIAWQPKMLSEMASRIAPVAVSGGATKFSVLTDSNNPERRIVGYQAAYTEFTSQINKNFGYMDTDLNYWTITRKFRQPVLTNTGTPITPITTPWGPIYPEATREISAYINPASYELPWVDSNATGNNFIVQIQFLIKQRTLISKNPLPASF